MVGGVLWSLANLMSIYMRGRPVTFHCGLLGRDSTSYDKRGNRMLTQRPLSKQGLQLTPTWEQHRGADRAVVLATTAATQVHGSMARPGEATKAAPQCFCNGHAEQDGDGMVNKDGGAGICPHKSARI